MKLALSIFVLLIVLNSGLSALAQTSEISAYDGGSNRTLRYLFKPASDPSNQKLYIFLGGDGEGCEPFNPKHFEDMGKVLSLDDAWIVPETAKQALCLSGEYRKLDFNHRVLEVKNLFLKLQSDPRFLSKKIFLVAISGGAKAAILAISDLPQVEGLVLINGIANDLETMFYNQIIQNGLRLGKNEIEIQQSIDQQKSIFDSIKSNCSAETVTWTDRSNLFWCQLIQDSASIQPMYWPQKKYLIVAGDQDNVVPVSVGIDRYTELKASNHEVRLKIFSGMGHNFYQFMGAAFSYMKEWSEK